MMTENNLDPANPNPEPGKKIDRTDKTQPTAPPKKKKRRLLLKIAAGLVALVVILVVLAPTLIGTSLVRGIVVSQINSSALNGKLAIKDWSFGWTSGVHIQGVQLDGANSEHLLSVANIDVPISLLKAATGNLDLGDVTVKGVDFNVQLDSQGQLNIQKAIKPGNASAPPPARNQPSKLPNIKGTIHLEDVTGTFQDDVHKVTVGLPEQTPLNVTVVIKDINQPIEESVDLGIQVDETDFVKVKVSGTVSAIQNSVVDTDKLSADQTIELSDGDVSAVSQVLHAMHLDLNVTGRMNGKITAKVNTLDNISADVGMNFAGLSAGGQQLNGDTVALQSCQIGVTASVASTDGKNAQIKLDLPVTLQPAGNARADHLNIHADVPQDSLKGMANVLAAIGGRLAKTTAGAAQTATVGGPGQIKIDADFDVASLVNQVPDVAHLEKGTSLTSGDLVHETTITIANGQAVIATDTQLKNFAGTANGSPVHVNDVDATAGVSVVGGDHPDLRDMKLGLTSAFASVSGGGATLGKLSVQGTSDLSKLQQQISQVIDLDALMKAPAGSHVSLGGMLVFDAHTNGDLTADESDIGVGADFTATAVNITIPGRRTINEPKFVASIGANLHHTASQFVEAARGVNISAESPAINFAAGGDVTLSGRFGASTPSFKISKGTVDLRLLQEEFGGALSLFVPKPADGTPPTLMQRVADNSVRIASGSVNISGEVKCDQTGIGFIQPLAINVQPTDLTVQDDMGTTQTAHVPAVALVISGNGSVNDQNVATLKNLTMKTTVGTDASPLFDLEISSDASVPLGSSGTMSAPRIEIAKCDGDLPGLQSAMGPLLSLVMPAPAAASTQPSIAQMVAENVLVCTSGKLSASMLASCDGTTVTMQKPLTVALDGVSLEQRKANSKALVLLNNETVRLVASASLTGQMSKVQDLNVGVDSSFAKKISISNGQIVLATRQGEAMVPAGPFNMVQSVTVEADDVDLARLDAVANSLFNQAATSPPTGEKTVLVVPPPQVTGGMATLKLDVSSSGSSMTANISQATVHGLAIKSGGNTTSWPNDISAKLNARLDSQENQLTAASVTQLSLDSGVGTTVGLTDQKPIVVTNLSDPANMSVQADLMIDGDIAPLARLAEVFGAAKPNSYPYSGHFHFNEPLSKVASQPRLQLAGGGAITKFVVMGQPGPNGAAAQPVFSEDNISVKNPLEFDFKTFSLLIDKANPIAIVLNSTGAAGVNISGTINDVALKRQIAADNPVVVGLSYDLAKLWPIVKPVLSPSLQQTLADLTISGKESRELKFIGSLPADKPFSQAVANLSGGGYLTVDSLSTQGITIQNFDIPFSITRGVLRTVYPDQPESSNAPHPAMCNGGTLDIGVSRVDLRTDPMLLYMPRVNGGTPLNILNGVSINPAMSKNILGKVLNNPAFVNANQAQGLVTVTILHLEKLPLSGLMMESSPQNQGTAEVQYSVTGLQLGSELLAVFGNASVSAEINNADVKLAAGRVTEDTTMMIDGNKPLRFAGVVVLATEQFAPMTAYIPPALLGNLIPLQDRQYIPDTIVVPMKGDMNHPKIQLDQTIAQILKDAGKKAVINGLLQGLQHIH